MTTCVCLYGVVVGGVVLFCCDQSSAAQLRLDSDDESSMLKLIAANAMKGFISAIQLVSAQKYPSQTIYLVFDGAEKVRGLLSWCEIA